METPNLVHTLLCSQKPTEGQYIGGIATLCNDYIDKAKIFRNNGVDLDYFSYEYPEGSLWNKFRIPKVKNIIYGIAQIRALRKFLKKSPKTCVHIHTSRKVLFFKDVLLANAIHNICKGPILMTIHVGDLETVFHNKYTRKFLIWLMNKSIDNVLFLSEHMRQQFISAGLNKKQTTVLYNFFNIAPLAPEDKLQNPNPRLIYLGSINREKGIVEMLTALNNVGKNFHLDLCGTVIEPDLQPEFDRLVNALGEKVKFHGYVGKTEKERLLKQADILILPSYREGLPISVIEALATSCALIVTPVGAIPEILSEENAIIIKPRDTEAIIHAVDSLFDNPELMNAMKIANFTKSKQFSEEDHIHKLCGLYKQQKSTNIRN